MYDLMKVFDCQKMPDVVRNYFFANSEAGNDCLVQRTVEPEEDYDEATDMWINPKFDPVTQWLLDNGADQGETVLVKHWW